ANLGKISQSIDFKKDGDYELSFKIAGGTQPTEPIDVDLDGPRGTFTPTSNVSFNQVTISFKTTAGTHTLSFTGMGPLGTSNRVVSIDDVAIKFVAPQITDGPKDLDPTSKITLKGSHFGNDKGKFR